MSPVAQQTCGVSKTGPPGPLARSIAALVRWRTTYLYRRLPSISSVHRAQLGRLLGPTAASTQSPQGQSCEGHPHQAAGAQRTGGIGPCVGLAGALEIASGAGQRACLWVPRARRENGRFGQLGLMDGGWIARAAVAHSHWALSRASQSLGQCPWLKAAWTKKRLPARKSRPSRSKRPGALLGTGRELRPIRVPEVLCER